MRGPTCGILTLAAVGGLALSAAGQVEGNRARTVTMGNAAHPARLPYTAEYKITRVQMLADGSTITHESTELFARDSQGRSVIVSSSISASEDQTVHTSVNINDPVARTHTFWFVPGQRVTVSKLPDIGSVRSSCAASAPAVAPQPAEAQRATPTAEDLGRQTFQGVEARGKRTTTTFPAGAIGNSDPLVRTDETWFSTTPGLTEINVREVNDDPRTGKMTRELVKFTQGEPDLAAFPPPQGYETVTQEVHNEVWCP
jgi:hypothetical protein